MARIDIRSNGGGGTVSTGVLQLENGVAMDATLRNVADQNNTTSPLKLSTTAVQVTSPLRITTSDASGFYLDAEDSATNNRFSIKRDPSSQEVTLDFASNPAGSTTLVGAIRTYRDGVNLSAAMSFIEDGSVGVGTSAPVGILHLYKSAAATRLAIDGDAGFNRLISYRTGAVQRFGLYVNNTAESGSNAGSNFAIRAYSDAGALLTTPFFINRATGNVGVNTLTGTAKLQVVGSGSTSATTSFLVQNSTPTNTFTIADDGVTTVNNPSTNVNTRLNGTTIDFYSSSTQLASIGKGNWNSNSTITFQASLTGNNDLRVSSSSVRARASLQVGNSDNSVVNGSWTGKVLTLGNGLGNGEVTEITSANPTTFPASQSDIFFYGGVGSGGNSGDIFVQHNNTSKRGNLIIGSNTRTASAIVSIASTTQGFLPPRMTTAQKNAIGTPVAGLMIYDTDLNKLCVYTGAGWETITSI